jgi:eukaryotic-like serine/threonine-protein kinase
MRLSAGTRVGSYEIIDLLGAGGMGEVYRARDSRLDRDVAIKVIAASLAGDPLRLGRFEQEARAAAAFNHPNILAVHDVGEHDGTPFIVTELLQGTTLRERMASERLPSRKAVEYAIQIARGLAAAHEKAIVHRDLKPENVFVTSDERVKVLDFGLAKLTHPEPAIGTTIPTMPPQTMPGVILGTAGYMAPEQARGLPADHRSDIFAFGAILYEMLTGQQAFRGDTPMDTMTAILTEEPAAVSATAAVPAALERIVSRCLEKNPGARFKSADDLAFSLEALSSIAGGAAPFLAARARVTRGRPAWTVVAASMLAVLVLAVAMYVAGRGSRAQAREMRLHIVTPPAANPAAFSVAPDGSRLAYVATGRLWVRDLASDTAQAMPGTEGATSNFWSPDSRSIAFSAGEQLKRLDLETGLVRVLTKAQATGGTWNKDGTIVFSPAPSAPLMRIDADGGGVTAVTHLDPPRQIAHRFPYFLPDGRHFLFFALGPLDHRGVYLGSLDGGTPYRLLESDGPAVPLPPDRILFMRDGALLAQRLDPSSLRLTGKQIPVSNQVVVAPMNFNLLAASAAASGLIAYRTAATERDWAWFDRSGRQIGTLNMTDNAQPTMGRLSPDGHTLALARAVKGNVDVWLLDVDRRSARRFTIEPVRERTAIWSPDGRRLLFDSERTGVFDLFERPADGGAETMVLTSPLPKSVEDWAPDGRSILFQVVDPKTNRDLWYLPLDGNRTPRPVRQAPFSEWGGRISPDGRWMAYQSNETGRDEIYITTFPEPGPKRQVSTDGGANAQWRRDGGELVYAGPNGELLSVSVALHSGAIEIGRPAVLFQTPAGAMDTVTFSGDAQRFVMTPDGQRFLLSIPTGPPAPITLLFNWAGLQD